MGHAGGSAPIEHTVEVACDAATAFEVFTSGMGEWWPGAYTPDPDTFGTVVVEPWVGGRVSMRMRDGAEYPFGEVTDWSPGERYAQTWTLAQPADHPSTLTVTFRDEPDGCLVRLEHGGWGGGNAEYRSKFGDWPVILRRYAEVAGHA